jgi:hypothetical protein
MSNPFPSLDRNKWARVNQLGKIEETGFSFSLRLHKIPFIFFLPTAKYLKNKNKVESNKRN